MEPMRPEGKMVAEPAFLVADFLVERLVAEAMFD
jgi:hypothetical protein